MLREQLEQFVQELGNVGIALSNVETKGEANLNYLLASIQKIRQVKKGMKELAEHEDYNKQRENV